MELTKEILEQLGKKFPAKDIGLKVQATFGKEGEKQGLIVPFIDARDVIKRLNEVVGGNWSDSYRKGETGGLECALTVCGITRCDVGESDNDTEAEKSAYSGSFKRAAVKFNIGLFLYDMPKMFAKIEPSGKSWKLSDGEESRLRRLIATALGEISETKTTQTRETTKTDDTLKDLKTSQSSGSLKVEKKPESATNGNGAFVAPKPVPTGNGGICAIHNEPTHEYKKEDGTTFWGHRHGKDACTAEPKPETVLAIPGGVK